MADRNRLTTSGARRTLPVVRWLQVGAVAGGMGIALVAGPAVASADDGSAADAASATPAASDSAKPAGAHRLPTGRTTGRSTAAAASRNTVRATAATAPRAQAGPASAVNAVRRSATVTPVTTAAKTAAVASATAQVSASAATDPFSQAAAFFALPWAPANTNPTLASWGLLAEMQIRDLVSGAPVPVVTDQSAVINGLFRQMLRRDPSAAELQNYLGIINLTGVNGVVASLYDSTAFRQGQVNAFYQEIFAKNADAGQLGLGTTLLLSGMSESTHAAAIAGTREAYAYSSSNGGTYGVPASAATYVSLLYRNLLGDIAQLGGVGQSYVNRINAGLPIGLAALEFVNSSAFRTAKIGELYNVLGTTPTTATVQDYVNSWFWNGGLVGIATSLLSDAANVAAVQAAPVGLPNALALQQYTDILLAPYDESPTGFVSLFETYLKTDPATGNPCPDGPSGPTSCNTALLDLIEASGSYRGMPNNILVDTNVIWADTRDLIPNQSEVDMDKSLRGPLSFDDTRYGDPYVQLTTYLAGGQIIASGGTILSTDTGTYILDGHHRWSTLFCINPNTQIQAMDLGYVPNPKEGLIETQVSIVNRDGDINKQFVEGVNLFTVSQARFDEKVREYINNNNVNARTITFTNAQGQVTGTIDTTNKQTLLVAFYNFLHPVPNTYEAQLPLYNTALAPEMENEVVTYLWGNVLLMRQYNTPPTGSVSRGFMPQPAPDTTYVPYMAPLQSGKVAFTFPIVSYIG